MEKTSIFIGNDEVTSDSNDRQAARDMQRRVEAFTKRVTDMMHRGEGDGDGRDDI